jgi:crotonobetainyl-CoA:carnitine CoA-transferase CaiB-like acyl-CoA transferase
MANWGLDYKRLKEIKSNLIMISLSAMGQTGPWKDFVGFGPTIQALSGFTYLTSFDKNSPLGTGYAYADTIVGLYAALAILLALEYRDRTGRGQYIDLSEYESMCTLIGPTLMDVSMNKKEVLPQGNCPDYILAAPYGCYKCLGTDRWCVIAVSDEGEWEALCRAMGDPSWTKEEEFSTLLKRKENSKKLDEFIEQWTAGPKWKRPGKRSSIDGKGFLYSIRTPSPRTDCFGFNAYSIHGQSESPLEGCPIIG